MGVCGWGDSLCLGVLSAYGCSRCMGTLGLGVLSAYGCSRRMGALGVPHARFCGWGRVRSRINPKKTGK